MHSLLIAIQYSLIYKTRILGGDLTLVPVVNDFLQITKHRLEIRMGEEKLENNLRFYWLGFQCNNFFYMVCDIDVLSCALQRRSQRSWASAASVAAS